MTSTRTPDVLKVVLDHLRGKNAHTVSTIRPDQDDSMPYVHVMMTGGPWRIRDPIVDIQLTFDVYGDSHGQVAEALFDLDEWLNDLPQLANPINAVYTGIVGQLPDMHLGRAVHTALYRFRTTLESVRS